MTYANDNTPVIPTVREDAKRATPLPQTEFRLTINEHDSWSGPDVFYRFCPTLAEAIKEKNRILADIKEDRASNAGKPTPEYYITVGDIHEVVRTENQVFVGKIVG